MRLVTIVTKLHHVGDEKKKIVDGWMNGPFEEQWKCHPHRNKMCNFLLRGVNNGRCE